MKRIIVLSIAVLIFISCKQSYNGELLYMQSNPEKGFNFPYLLFLPEDMPRDKELTLIVEPNNTGMVTDDFKKHIEKAQRQATRPFYTGNFLAKELKNPLLVPIFPRSRKESRVYTHSLDRDVMLKNKPPLQRIDLQLLAMKENALDTATARFHRVVYSKNQSTASGTITLTTTDNVPVPNGQIIASHNGETIDTLITDAQGTAAFSGWDLTGIAGIPDMLQAQVYPNPGAGQYIAVPVSRENSHCYAQIFNLQGKIGNKGQRGVNSNTIQSATPDIERSRNVPCAGRRRFPVIPLKLPASILFPHRYCLPGHGLENYLEV